MRGDESAAPGSEYSEKEYDEYYDDENEDSDTAFGASKTHVVYAVYSTEPPLIEEVSTTDAPVLEDEGFATTLGPLEPKEIMLEKEDRANESPTPVKDLLEEMVEIMEDPEMTTEFIDDLETTTVIPTTVKTPLTAVEEKKENPHLEQQGSSQAQREQGRDKTVETKKFAVADEANPSRSRQNPRKLVPLYERLQVGKSGNKTPPRTRVIGRSTVTEIRASDPVFCYRGRCIFGNKIQRRKRAPSQ